MNPKHHGIGKRFTDATLDGVDPEHFKAVFEYHEQAAKHLREGRGLLLSGNPGIGKTWAIIALMQRLFERMGSSTNRWDFYVVTAPVLFERYTPDADRRKCVVDDYREQPFFRTYERVHALVINDLGKEDRSREWLAEGVNYKLGRLLRSRHEAELPVFFTTNLPLRAPDHMPQMQTVASVYGDSIWSLIYDLTAVRAQTQAPDRRITPAQ